MVVCVIYQWPRVPLKKVGGPR